MEMNNKNEYEKEIKKLKDELIRLNTILDDSNESSHKLTLLFINELKDRREIEKMFEKFKIEKEIELEKYRRKNNFFIGYYDELSNEQKKIIDKIKRVGL